MAIKKRTIMKPVKKLCEVKYYVWATPIIMTPFIPDPPFVLEDKFFDTRKEAEELLEKWKKSDAWLTYEIREEVEEI